MIEGRGRFFWILATLLVSGFLTTSLISYYVARHSFSEQISANTLPLTSDNIYSEIQQDLLRPVFISSLMAQDTFVRDWVISGEKDAGQMTRYLKEIQEKYGTVTSFYVSERTRQYYHPSGILKTVSKGDAADAWYFKACDLPAGENYDINIDVDTADRKSTTVFVNYRVYDYADKLIGVIGVGLAVEVVKHLIEVYQERYGRRVFFIDRQGKVTLHGSNFDGMDSIRQRQGLASIATRILTSPSGSFSYVRNGKTVYLNSRLVPEFDWYLMVEQEDNPVEQKLTQTLMGNLALSFVVTAGVLLLAHLTLGGYQRRLEEMASIDKLTGATNRQVFEIVLERALKGAVRNEGHVSVIMFDIDFFKRINDTHGHLAGDLVIKTVVRTASDYIRTSDTLCRWGGEEFVILLPDCELASAHDLADRIRAAIEGRYIATGRDTVSVTASFGVVEHQPDEDSLELMNRVDQALYQAKREGRNRVYAG